MSSLVLIQGCMVSQNDAVYNEVTHGCNDVKDSECMTVSVFFSLQTT